MIKPIAPRGTRALTLLALGGLLVNACGSLAFLAAPSAQPVDATPAVTTPGPSTVEADGAPLFTDPPLPTFEKSPGRGPERSPWAMPDCVDWVWQVDEIQGLDRLARISAIVVAGTFSGYGPGRWNTADGIRPVTDEYHDSAYDVTIVRDIEIGVETSVRGHSTDLAGAYVRGGDVGCDAIRYSHIPEMEPGSRWVFFLNPGPVGDADSLILPELLRTWPIDTDNIVTTDSGARMPLDGLRSVVDSTPYTPNDPFGG